MENIVKLFQESNQCVQLRKMLFPVTRVKILAQI